MEETGKWGLGDRRGRGGGGGSPGMVYFRTRGAGNSVGKKDSGPVCAVRCRAERTGLELGFVGPYVEAQAGDDGLWNPLRCRTHVRPNYASKKT